MSTTANTVCIGALGLVGAIDPEDTPSAAMLADAFRRLNNMMRSWSLQSLTIPAQSREVFPLVAGKGSTTNPYTVGPGGDFDTTRPDDLDRVGLILNQSLPFPTEIPRGLFTDDSYADVSQKDMTNSLFTNAKYEATFAGGFGSLYLWPVPDNALNSIALYRLEQLGVFTSPTATYELPEGCEEPIEYNLAKRLLSVYSVPAERKQDLLDLAKSSLAIYKRSNMKFTDLPIDPMFTPNNRSGGYDINTGNQ